MRWGGNKLFQRERVQVGDRVEILRPSYLAGKIGLIRGRENVVFGQTSDRWLAQVIPDDFVVSLKLEEFRPIE